MEKAANPINSRVLSFRYAFEGFILAFKEEPNLKIHFGIGVLVILAGLVLQISKIDWIIIITMIGLVISVELTNTSIEAVVDYLIREEHPGAKIAKDISAAAVLVSALTSAIIGVIIFMPYIFR